MQARQVTRPDLVLPHHSLDGPWSNWCGSMHNIGNVELSISNWGVFGNGGGVDCITGGSMRSGCRYPKGSPIFYLNVASLWIGGVVSRDTLVSEGGEMFPDISPFGDIRARSIGGPDGGDPDAVSEQDRICIYSDTFTVGVSSDYFLFRPHIPLGVEITQSSYAWSYGYTEDFILFDIAVCNISDNVLNDVYFGLWMVPMIGTGDGFALDDLCGFLTHVASPFGCGFVDTVNIAWSADNDGEPVRGEWVDVPRWNSGNLEASCRHVTGATFLRVPGDAARPTFNWWIYKADPTFDFAPRWRDNLRDFRTGGIGMPKGDVNKYHLLSNHELDYDQAFTASIRPTDTRWLYPDQERAADVTDGGNGSFLVSYGAFTVYPGQTLPLTFAYVAGENFHTN
ncbi:MAG: hypothetical protein KAW61_08270, partial [candidate division Zixibacteria bacterium]|nr:hypothetical protein [candidate division Zixibacteria bacterium]